MDHTFAGEVVEWRGPAPYYFLTVPPETGTALRAAASAIAGSWGTVPVRAVLGGTEWTTSLWSRDGDYLLPLKDAVRKPAGLSVGDTVELHVSFEPRKQRRAPQPNRVRQVPVRPMPRTAGSREPVTPEQLTIVPANRATWDDLEAVFGATGDTARCWCQRFRMLPKESWASEGPDELAARLRDQTTCGNPRATTTTGLIAYLADAAPAADAAGDRAGAGGDADEAADLGGARGDADATGDRAGAGGCGVAGVVGEPVGWCAVAPRAGHPRLLRDYRVPWLGRHEDKTDPSVWAITCFVTRAGFRRRGISRLLAQAAVEFARERGAGAIEGYPDLVDGGSVGTVATFADAGFAEVSRPGNRRLVMRIDF